MGKCKGQHLDVKRTQRKKGLSCIRKKSAVPLSSASADPEPPGGTSLELSQLGSQTARSEAQGQSAAGSQLPTTGLRMPASSLSSTQ